MSKNPMCPVCHDQSGGCRSCTAALSAAAMLSGMPAGDITKILQERGKRYGKFADHAHISQSIKERMCESGGWLNLTEDQTEALEMIAHKIARILNGDPNYADSWRDIAGYATLVADRLEGVSR